MRYVLATALAASVALHAQPANARESRYQVNIGAIDATDALTTLSAQTGISIATDGPLPRHPVSAVRGAMTVSEALDRMLRDLDLRAVRVGPRTYRIVRRRHAKIATSTAQPDVPPQDIIITGRKQAEILSGVPAPVAVYVPDDQSRAGVASTTHDVARGTEGLALTNGGPGRDRPFIRGFADSPFNGFSQSTVSIQFDDARITYDAPEPGLRLVDIARVEVLKGPQGPLYGTGALGGVFRIVTNRPVLGLAEANSEFGLSTTSNGGIGGQASGTLNLPLVSDYAAVRIVGYAAADPGWVDDVDGHLNTNRSLTLGGRVALRVAPADGWTIDLNALAQSIDTSDSQYVDVGGEDLSRNLSIREPRFGRVRMLQGTITGSVGSLKLTVATGQTWQDQRDLYDASASAAALGTVAPAIYRDARAYRVFDQEVRLASAPGSRFVWVAGASYLSATTAAHGALSPDGRAWSPFFELHRRVSETAVFGDGSLPLSPRLRFALGVRLFRASTEDNRFEDTNAATRAKTSFGVTPSTSLSFEIAPDQLIYARIGTAFRPGGLDINNSLTRRYDADEVRSIDLGGRVRLDRARLSLDGSVFRATWNDIQSDYLEKDGLIATHNAGRATILGAELSADWRPAEGWRVQLGAIVQRPRLTRAADGSELPRDLRLPVVPDVSARFTIAHDVNLGDWRITPDISANLVGATRLSFDPGLDRRMPPYLLGRIGLAAGRGGLTLRAGIDNVLDERADTFAFGNPFSVRTVRQYTPLRPRTVSISISHRF